MIEESIQKYIYNSIKNLKGIVVIDGYSGCGKTYIANEIRQEFLDSDFNINVFHLDSFATWEEPFAWKDKFFKKIYDPFIDGYDMVFDENIWQNNEIVDQKNIKLTWAPLLLIEGFGSGSRNIIPEIQKQYFFKPNSIDKAMERAIKRDGEITRQDQLKWKKYTFEWFKKDETEIRSEIVNIEV